MDGRRVRLITPERALVILDTGVTVTVDRAVWRHVVGEVRHRDAQVADEIEGAFQRVGW